MRIAVVSDTHMPRRGPALPPACRARLEAADLILHAGDLCDAGTLAMLRGIGPPLVAVHGNVDEPAVRRALPERAEVDAPGLRLGLVHDAGPRAGRLARCHRRFPGCGGVVFGHSHLPLYEVEEGGFFILNPGSPTDRRRAPRHTMAEIVLAGDGRPPEVSFWAVDEPTGPLGGRRPAGVMAPREPRGTRIDRWTSPSR